VVLFPHLAKRGYKSVVDAVAQNAIAVEPEAFDAALRGGLDEGTFRVVLVLDSAPPELVQLVGYLAGIAPAITIDLLTVSRYQVAGDTILVPQRVDPERYVVERMTSAGDTKTYYLRDGGADFLETLEGLSKAQGSKGLRLYEWAKGLEKDGLATLWGSHGTTYVTLLPHVIGHDAGLVTLVADGNIWTWRSVFEKKAPIAIAGVEKEIGGPLKQGGTITDPTDGFLASIRAAYEEARTSDQR
jgi:hypothetical protein